MRLRTDSGRDRAERAPFDQRDGNHEARDFVAGEDGAFQQAHARDARVVRVCADRTDNRLWRAPLTQNLHPAKRVLLQRRVAFVVKVVQQPHNAPEFLVLAEEAGVVAHARLHRQRVAA
jgi:hypothetical protein